MGEKMDCDASKEIEAKDEDVHALFATSMPRDIWANPSLAALAGLIDEDEEREENVKQAEQGNLNVLRSLCCHHRGCWIATVALLPSSSSCYSADLK